MSKGAAKVRTPPQRTCVGCGTVRGKPEMVRVIRTPEGSVVADPTGKRAGRGAYLCARRVLEAGPGKGRLERSLKVKITSEDADALRAYAESLGPSFRRTEVKA
jgi:predicted RNA-binding protein YlxR (DUF448 family)